MDMFVPSWDHDDRSKLPFLRVPSNSSVVPSLDDEVAELTWENGQVAIHCLAPDRVAGKRMPRYAGTLQSVVNQATHLKATTNGGGYYFNEVAPWFDHHPASVKPISGAAIDALVPGNINDNQEQTTHMLQSVPAISSTSAGFSTGVGSCSCSGGAAMPGVLPWATYGREIDVYTGSESATRGGRDVRTEFTFVSFGSLANTSSSKDCSKTTGEDIDSRCYSMSQRRKGTWKPSVSTKRSRASANHIQAERKRRDKINKKMSALQKLVPNSCKTDKASVLDEVIEYLKQLQTEVRVMMNTSHIIMTLPMMPSMGGLMQPFVPLPNAFIPVAGWTNPDNFPAFLACQSQLQAINHDAFNNQLAGLYRQLRMSAAPTAALL